MNHHEIHGPFLLQMSHISQDFSWISLAFVKVVELKAGRKENQRFRPSNSHPRDSKFSWTGSLFWDTNKYHMIFIK